MDGMNRSRITKLAFAIVLLCFLLSTFVSLWSLGIMARQNMRELSRALASRVYDSISGELSDPIVAAQTMASDSFLIEALSKEREYGQAEITDRIRAYLSGIKNALDYESAFVVSEATGRYYSYNGLSKIINPREEARDGWYAAFVDRGRRYELDVDRDEVSQDAWTVFVDARIEDHQGRLLGVCGVGVHMTGSEDLFAQLERDYHVKVNLIDQNGLVQVDTDESRIEKATLSGISLSTDDDYVYRKAGRNRYVITKYIDKLGWYLVVQSEGVQERSQFISVIVLNIVLCLLVMVILVIAIRIIIARTKALSAASYRDQTTLLLNRRAFEEEKARLGPLALDEDFIYLTADLNGLKAANDNLGHAAGDELIRGAAACLKTCFGRYGRIYRIGGDEFAAMLVLTEARMKEVMVEFEAIVDTWSGEKVHSLSISCGYAASKEFPSENIAELGRIADERMYAAKAAYYKRTGKDRRT